MIRYIVIYSGYRVRIYERRNEENEEDEDEKNKDDMMSGINWVQNKGKEDGVDEKSELINRHFQKRINETRNSLFFRRCYVNYRRRCF